MTGKGAAYKYLSDTLGALRDVLPPVDIGNAEQLCSVEVFEGLYALWKILGYVRDRLDAVGPADGLDAEHEQAILHLHNELSWAEDAYIGAAEDLLRLLGEPVPPEPGAHEGNDGGDFVAYLLPTPESIRFGVAAEEGSHA